MNNDEKAEKLIKDTFPHLWMIKEQMEKIGVNEVDMLRLLYYIENVQKLSGYGKVTINLKRGDVISVTGESVMISQSELVRDVVQKRIEKL